MLALLINVVTYFFFTNYLIGAGSALSTIGTDSAADIPYYFTWKAQRTSPSKYNYNWRNLNERKGSFTSQNCKSQGDWQNVSSNLKRK